MSGLYLGPASGLRAQQIRLDTVANNIANLSTTGFRSARADMVDRAPLPVQVGRAGNGDGQTLAIGTGVNVDGVSRSFESGAWYPTGHALDLAIVGNDSFFQVISAEGTPAYTRAGSFTVDGLGRLATSSGDLIAPLIELPPGASITSVTETGIIMAVTPDSGAPAAIGQLQLARFPNPDGLQAIGDNLFVPTEASGMGEVGLPGSAGFPLIASGILEAANVDLAEQTVQMLEAQRAYSMNLRALQTLDEMVGSAIHLRT